MTTLTAATLVDRFKAGQVDLSDIPTIERTDLDGLLEEVAQKFPVPILDRQQRRKRELGFALIHRHRVSHERQESKTPRGKQTAVTDTLERCLLLTAETDRLTTIAVLTSLRFRTLRGDNEPVEFTCGAGYSLYRDVDGWKIKLLEEKTTHLEREALGKYGWLIGPEVPVR